MKEDTELFYFQPDELKSKKTLKDVLDGVGNQTDVSTPLKHELRRKTKLIDKEWEEIYEEINYVLENDASAKYLETDKGIFIFSESKYLSKNTKSLESRSNEFF